MQAFLVLLMKVLQGLKHAPAVIMSLWQIIQTVKDIWTKIKTEKQKNDLEKAIDKAKETKDTKDLEVILNGAFNIKLIEPEEKKSPEILTAFVPSFIPEEKPAEAIIDPPIEEPVLVAEALPEPKAEEPEESGFSLGNWAAIGALGIAFMVLTTKKASAAMSFGGSQNALHGLNVAGHVVNNKVGMSARMGSKIIPVLIAFILLGMTSCEERPKLKIKLYAGDSSKQAMVREDEEIKASDRQFDNLMAISYSDYKCLYNALIVNCKEYYNPNYSCESMEAKEINQ